MIQNRIRHYIGLILLCITLPVFAQPEPNNVLDSLYILEVEELKERDKVLHAEPLFIDLIRDLGARKGEREWNVGLGINPRKDYDEYETLVEYEWAPMDRLGLEIELPFSFFFPENGSALAPKNRLNSLKVATQWSFLVSQKYSTSMAIGYLHEFEITPFANYSNSRFLTGNIFNPIFVAAKRWGSNFHTLIYTGPAIHQEYGVKGATMEYEMHTNFHYLIPGTRNFIGMEVNKYFSNTGADITLRPQMRLGIKDNIMIGIVTGIHLGQENDRLSTFIRLIYEPKHH